MRIVRDDFGECDETAQAPVQAAAHRKGMMTPKRQEIPDPGEEKTRASVSETPEGTYRVEFAYDEDRVAAVKQIDGARFEREKDGYGRTVRGWWEMPMIGWHRLRLVQEGFMDASAIPDRLVLRREDRHVPLPGGGGALADGKAAASAGKGPVSAAVRPAGGGIWGEHGLGHGKDRIRR